MVHNKMIACEFCGTKIRLRIQVGYFDIPFRLACPTCSTKIKGKIHIGNEAPSLKWDIDHAIDVDGDMGDPDCYIAELSAEFPTRKLHKNPAGDYELTPFMRAVQLYGDGDEALKATREAARFTALGGSSLRRLQPLFDLFWNGHGSLLYSKLGDEITQYPWIPLSRVSNDHDAAMVLHQLFLTASGVTCVLPSGALGQYAEIGQTLLTGPKTVRAICAFLDSTSVNLNDAERKAFTLIDSFADIYELLLPVVALTHTGHLDRVDRDLLGIMTTSYEDLISFYAQSYEWILDSIPLLIGLNNILMRGSYNACVNDKDYSHLLKMLKYQRLKFLVPDEPLSPPTNDLRNRVRNAIQHFDYKIDDLSQVVTFTDSRAGKTEHLYLIDFAALCLSNFNMVVYLLEVIYTLRKTEFLVAGIAPSFLTTKASG